MRTDTEIRVGTFKYKVAFPIGAFEAVQAIEPNLRRVMQDLAGENSDERLAQRICAIGLEYGGSGVTTEVVYERHGWGVFREMALATLMCGFVGMPEGKRKAAADKSSPTTST